MTTPLESPVPMSVSNSEIQTFKQCRRRWYLSYYLQYGLKIENENPTGARFLGSRVHAALQLMYEKGANPVAVVQAIYDDEITRNSEFPEHVVELRKEADMARAMLDGYVEWLAETGKDEGLIFVSAETEIVVNTDIKNVTLRGKLDQRLRRESDGARLFLDHKTVGNLSELPRMAPIDEQMITYHLLEWIDAVQRTGDAPPEPTDGGLYNMLRKVKRTERAKPPFYDRVEVHHNRATLASHWKSIHRILSEIVATRVALDAGGDHQYLIPKSPSRACLWMCPFSPVCPMLDDGSRWQDMLAEWYQIVNPYERYDTEIAKGVILE